MSINPTTLEDWLSSVHPVPKSQLSTVMDLPAKVAAGACGLRSRAAARDATILRVEELVRVMVRRGSVENIWSAHAVRSWMAQAVVWGQRMLWEWMLRGMVKLREAVLWELVLGWDRGTRRRGGKVPHMLFDVSVMVVVSSSPVHDTAAYPSTAYSSKVFPLFPVLFRHVFS